MKDMRPVMTTGRQLFLNVFPATALCLIGNIRRTTMNRPGITQMTDPIEGCCPKQITETHSTETFHRPENTDMNPLIMSHPPMMVQGHACNDEIPPPNQGFDNDRTQRANRNFKSNPNILIPTKQQYKGYVTVNILPPEDREFLSDNDTRVLANQGYYFHSNFIALIIKNASKGYAGALARMMKHRKMRYQRWSPRSLSSSPPRNKFSRCSDDKTKPHINGALSPLHTRRGLPGDIAKPTPDFAEFDYLSECPKLLAVTSDDCQDVTAAFSDLDRLQMELEQILVHTTDHQKKICGEITFLTTGDYPSDDISNRPMPVYELKSSEPLPSCSKKIESEPTVDDPYMSTAMDWLDEGFDVWPPINLPQKFWIFAREYLDPIDEEYLQQWWSSIVQLFRSTDIGSGPMSKTSPGLTKKSFNCDVSLRNPKITLSPPHDSKSTLSPSSKLDNQNPSPRRSRSFISNRNTSSPIRLRHFGGDESSPPPTKLARYELRGPSHAQSDTTPLIDGLLSAYITGKKDTVGSSHCNGILRALEKRKSPKKESISLSTLRNSNEWKVKKDAFETDGTFRFPDQNGITYEEDDISTSCVPDPLEMLNCALTDYLNKSDEDSDINRSNKAEDVEELVRKCSAGKKRDSEDEVSVALKKLQEELSEKEIPWRSIVAKIWHRLLAEFLRVKLEHELDEADQKMFDTYDKYYCEYPRRRPVNEREKDECRDALQQRNDAAQAYYGKHYVPLGKWRRKR